MTSLSAPSLRTGKIVCQSREEVDVLDRETRASVGNMLTDNLKRMPSKTAAYTFHTNLETGECELEISGSQKNRKDLGDMKEEAKKTTRQTQMKMRMRAKLIAKGVIVPDRSVTWAGTSWS